MSASDLQVVFPAIIFVTFLVLLSSFFVFTSGGDVEILTNMPDNDTMPYDANPIWKGKNSTELAEEESFKQNNTNWIELAAGVSTVFIGIFSIPFTGAIGVGVAGLGCAGVIDSLPDGVVEIGSIPVVGPLVSAVQSVMDVVGTALASFWGLLTWRPAFIGFPVFGILIMGPLIIFFFIFIIRFIRGQ